MHIFVIPIDCALDQSLRKDKVTEKGLIKLDVDLLLIVQDDPWVQCQIIEVFVVILLHLLIRSLLFMHKLF